jgi:hypothetical protein
LQTSASLNFIHIIFPLCTHFIRGGTEKKARVGVKEVNSLLCSATGEIPRQKSAREREIEKRARLLQKGIYFALLGSNFTKSGRNTLQAQKACN